MPSDLSVERITVKRGDLEEVVLPRLLGTVFHVTPAPTFEMIRASGVIRSNQDGQLSFTYPQSQNNYGRRRGCVCLFDLRDVPDGELRDALRKFYFLNHAPAKGHPVFLFLDPQEYGKLIPWTVAKGNYKEVLIPYVESWYPTDLPVSALAGALAVTVEPDDADSAFRGRMGRFRRDNKDALDTGLTIEASTLAQLKALRKSLIDPKIEQHRGRFVNSAGDSALADFASVVDAVNCAVSIQTALKAQDAELPRVGGISHRRQPRRRDGRGRSDLR